MRNMVNLYGQMIEDMVADNSDPCELLIRAETEREEELGCIEDSSPSKITIKSKVVIIKSGVKSK